MSQIISTFGGCGVSCTLLGDGGPATAAVVLDPNVGVFNKHGIFYYSSATGQRIRKIDTSGIITTVAGTGSGGFSADGMSATTSKLDIPSAVALDTFGNLFIADAGNHRIRKVDIITGIISTIAGNGTSAFFGDSGQATAAEISVPQDICFDKKGNLYISDQVNLRVRKINTLGIISTFAGNGSFSATGTGDGGQATNATFNLLSCVVADDTGNIYIGDYNAGEVRKVDTFGIISTIAGNGNYSYIGDGMQATSAQFSPVRIALDSMGCLIIGDRVNERVYRVDPAGFFHTITGTGSSVYGGDGGPATAASFDVGGVSFDHCWNLYITDINNRRIRKVTYNPTCDPHTHTTIGDSTTLNVKTITNGSVSIYPNPAYTFITVTAAEKISSITVSNIMGQVVLNKEGKSNKEEVDVLSLPAGVYVVKVKDDEGKTTVSKIIKQ